MKKYTFRNRSNCAEPPHVFCMAISHKDYILEIYQSKFNKRTRTKSWKPYLRKVIPKTIYKNQLHEYLNYNESISSRT